VRWQNPTHPSVGRLRQDVPRARSGAGCAEPEPSPAECQRRPQGRSGGLEGWSRVPQTADAGHREAQPGWREDLEPGVLATNHGVKLRLIGGMVSSPVTLQQTQSGSSASPQGLQQGPCTCRNPDREAPLPWREGRNNAVPARIPIGKLRITRGIAASTVSLEGSRSGSSASLETMMQRLRTCRDPDREAQKYRGIVARTRGPVKSPTISAWSPSGRGSSPLGGRKGTALKKLTPMEDGGEGQQRAAGSPQPLHRVPPGGGGLAPYVRHGAPGTWGDSSLPAIRYR